MNKVKNQIGNQIVFRYIITLALFLIGFPALVILTITFASSRVWHDSDPLYQLLRAMLDYFVIIVGTVYVGGIVGITAYYLNKPIRYLNEIIQAARDIANPSDETIHLSRNLKSVEDELNLVREQTLRSAIIAKDAEKRKNDLVIYLAHDLKTPLTSIIGYLTLLKDEPNISTEIRARYTDIALNKAERLEYLVNEFFEITRFNLTTQILQKENTNISVMLQQIAYEFTPILLEKNLEFDLEIPNDIYYVCDPNKLERVFDNLIRNAINYSFENTMILLHVKNDENNIELRITNAGKTIPPEILCRIFEQFFRLDNSRQSSTGGTGLGLAIAKEIIELHGGSITVESEDEKIQFIVVLPKMM